MNDKELRKKLNHRDAKSLNKFGDRIYWVRTQLGLTQAQVARETGIPAANLNGREAGVRSTNIEEFLVLAIYFNDLWKNAIESFGTMDPENEAFLNGAPKFNNTKIHNISPMWLIFGIIDE